MRSLWPMLALLLQTQQAPPKVDPRLARLVPPSPAPNGFIADVPNLIPAADRARINSRIQALQSAGAGDIGVAIIPSLEDRDVSEVAVAIYRTWRIGRIDTLGATTRNAGALLLIVPKELAPDHKGYCWIGTGTGAEGVLTDASSAAICRDSVIPYLKRREYAGAVDAGTAAIADRLQHAQVIDIGNVGEAPQPRHRIPWWYPVGGFAALLAAVLGGGFWRRYRPRHCPVCGQRMHRLSETADDAALNAGQRLEEKLKSVDYDVWQCPAGHESVLAHRAVFTPYRKCPVCHVRAEKTTRRVVEQPTYLSTGLAEDTHTCRACGATRVEKVTLPRRTPPSSGGSSGWSGGGGGGGSSFGGSGSTSGGGGGSSY